MDMGLVEMEGIDMGGGGRREMRREERREVDYNWRLEKGAEGGG